ncbi:MAG: GNAT family N-acetyltransferase [Zavarzinella sp.]
MDTLFSFLPPRACQAVVPRSQSKWGKILEKNHFWQIGTVVQLCLNGTERNKLEHLHDIGPVSLRPLSSSEVDLWLDLLLECQLHSSDFPELNKHLSRKSLQDLYLGKGILGRWLIFFHQQPVGVLAIAGPQLEYLGVLPEYRDRGIGQTIMRIIVDEPLNVSQLSVDGRNSSARHIYEKLGWEEMHERCDVFYRAHPLD